MILTKKKYTERLIIDLFKRQTAHMIEVLTVSLEERSSFCQKMQVWTE